MENIDVSVQEETQEIETVSLDELDEVAGAGTFSASLTLTYTNK